MRQEKILIYGYGNIGRQDDGLGVCFAENMEKWAFEKEIKNIFFDTNYQLNIEDSLLMADMDIVLFADASNSGTDFSIKKLEGTKKISSFSTHKVSPEFLVFLCEKFYNKFLISYLITIKGSKWGIGQKLSQIAQRNLQNATSFLEEQLLKDKQFDLLNCF